MFTVVNFLKCVLLRLFSLPKDCLDGGRRRDEEIPRGPGRVRPSGRNREAVGRPGGPHRGHVKRAIVSNGKFRGGERGG